MVCVDDRDRWKIKPATLKSLSSKLYYLKKKQNIVDMSAVGQDTSTWAWSGFVIVKLHGRTLFKLNVGAMSPHYTSWCHDLSLNQLVPLEPSLSQLVPLEPSLNSVHHCLNYIMDLTSMHTSLF